MRKGLFYPPGASPRGHGIQFVFSAPTAGDIKLVLYGEKGPVKEFSVGPEYSGGCIYSVIINNKDIPRGARYYRIYDGADLVDDRFSSGLKGLSKYGKVKDETFSLINKETFDWQGDLNPRIPFNDSIIYGIHVRGFTKHSSSQVKAKGTFLGITEKIPYLKDLGVNAIELMPCYEFDEIIRETTPTQTDDGVRVNFWGFTDSAWYFAPKSAYSYSKDAPTEFREMVRALHSQGIEVIMQFYFPNHGVKGIILDILRYWVLEYHIDGFRLMGNDLPICIILNDPYLKNTKFIFGDEALNAIRDTGLDDGKRAAIMPLGFKINIRRAIKGDEDMLKNLISHLKANEQAVGIVNAITTHDGFTLKDLVSYDFKHNEANGENGRDGERNNYSWNCGEEGASRKKAINSLRLKQVKNALLLMFISQGTPYIRGGDEFGQTQDGNNNPYCQDNNITYIDWRLAVKNAGLVDFVKTLICLRKSHRTFSRNETLMDMDYRSLGCPDISYHGEELWKVNLEGHYRYVGILYNGAYVTNDDGTSDPLYYAAINLHWEDHNFALPKPAAGYKWEIVICSDNDEPPLDTMALLEDSVLIPKRTIRLYHCVEDGSDKKSKTALSAKVIPGDVTSF